MKIFAARSWARSSGIASSVSLLLIGALAIPPAVAAETDSAAPVNRANPVDDDQRADDAAAAPADTHPDAPPAGDAQDDAAASAEKPYWRKNLFSRCWKDQGYLFKTWLPGEAHRPSFIIPMAVGTAFALASSRDADASQPDFTVERDFNSDVKGNELGAAHFFTTVGDGFVGALMIGTAYLAGRWSGHDRFAETASLSAEAVLNTGLWVTILKGLTARTRPSGGGTGQFFDYHPAAGQQIGSFPSGHASGAFAAATVFAGMYREDHPWVPWVAYGTAGLVGASRVALGRHFPSDVVVGALIGNSFGRMVLARRQEESRVAVSTVAPFYDPSLKEAGVMWTRQW